LTNYSDYYISLFLESFLSISPDLVKSFDLMYFFYHTNVDLVIVARPNTMFISDIDCLLFCAELFARVSAITLIFWLKT